MNDEQDNVLPGTTRTAHENGRMLPAGTTLAKRYRIENLVGVGGMGMVYRARDLELDVTVAVKVMRPEKVGEQQMLERFRRELVLARQVTHRNVVRIHDIGADQGRLFLTMDYIDGRPLDDLLEKQGSLPPDSVVAIGGQLARALAAAHAEGIVHRDLKPANILVAADDRAFITDFGIARSLTASGLTEAGGVIGTPDYLSPEQASGAEVDARSDIYALGLILYRMLTGELPFRGGTYEEVIAQHTTGHARDISRTGVNLPRWLRRVVNRCLQRNPADRYSSAEALAGDLERQGSRWRASRRLRLASGVAVFLAVAVAAVAVYFQHAQTGTKATVAEAAPIQARFTVGVLPLQRRGDAGQWTGEGLAEVLGGVLAESGELQVISGTRLERTLEDLAIDPATMSAHEQQQLVELLDIDRLVSGSIVNDGTNVRIQLAVTAVEMPNSKPRTVSVNVESTSGWLTAVDRLGRELGELLQVSRPVLETAPLTESLSALEDYTSGLHALRDGDSLGAVPRLQSAVKQDAGFVAAWVALSESYAALGKDREARDAAGAAVRELGPDNGRIAFEARAQEAVVSGEFEKAERFLRQLLERYPHEIETRVELAEIIGESGRFQEAIETLRPVVVADTNHPRAWYLMGKYAILNGDSQRAVDEYLVRALVVQNKLDNDQGRADVLNALGIAWHELGKLERARDYYLQAAELRERIGDERGVVAALSNIARVQMLEGDLAGAREQFQDALQRLESLGDRGGAANMLNELGILEEEQGDYTAALARYREALQVRQQLGDQRGVAESYNNVGYAYFLLGAYDNAAVYLQRSLDAFGDMNNPDGEMQAQQALGLLEIRRGNWQSASRAFLSALEIAREIDFPHAAAVSHGNLGYIAQLQGRFEAAATSYAEATAIMESVGDLRGLAEFTLHEAELALELGMSEKSAVLISRAKSALSDSANLEQTAWLATLQGRAELLQERSSSARGQIDNAIELADRSGSEIARLRAGVADVQWLMHAGDLARAYEEAARYRAAADKIGDLPMQLQFHRLEALASVASGQRERARVTLQAATRLVHDVGEYALAWQIHSLNAAAMESGDEQEHERTLAQGAWHRVRDGMNEQQREAFDAHFALEIGGMEK